MVVTCVVVTVPISPKSSAVPAKLACRALSTVIGNVTVLAKVPVCCVGAPPPVVEHANIASNGNVVDAFRLRFAGTVSVKVTCTVSDATSLPVNPIFRKLLGGTGLVPVGAMVGPVEAKL